MIDIGIKHWIDYNPNVGVEALHMIGLPGTGKSNMSTGLLQKCLQKGEMLIMPGDRFCEWRHFPFHPKFPTKIRILIPKDVEIYYHNFEPNGWFQEPIEYEDLDIFHYLDKDHKLLVIYDQHMPLTIRSMFWVHILSQLLNRKEYLDFAIGMLFHEAGIYFSEFTKGDQWRAIKNFSELFVESRKGLVRILLESQIDTEIESTIRRKCMYACIRKARLSRSVGWPKPLIKAAPFTAINEFHWVFGGLYVRRNTITKYYEKKSLFKMVPRMSIYGGTQFTTTMRNDEKLSEIIQNCYNSTKSIRETSRILRISRDMVRNHIKVVE